MPIVRSPCTLEWPRTGHAPAPGLPIIPRSNSTLTISRMVGTALRCWVRPIAQQTMVRSDRANMSATFSICSVDRPVASRMSSQDTSATCLRYSSKPAVYLSTNAESTVSFSTSRRPSAVNKARSPAMRTGTNSSASGVPLPTNPRTFCGLRKRIRPASGSGLIAMILAPFCLARSSADSMRG